MFLDILLQTIAICGFHEKLWNYEKLWLEPTKSLYQTELTNYNAIDKTSALGKNGFLV